MPSTEKNRSQQAPVHFVEVGHPAHVEGPPVIPDADLDRLHLRGLVAVGRDHEVGNGVFGPAKGADQQRCRLHALGHDVVGTDEADTPGQQAKTRQVDGATFAGLGRRAAQGFQEGRMRAQVGRRDDPPDQKCGSRNHEQAQRPPQPTVPPAAICQTTHRHRVPQKVRTRKPQAGERPVPTICGREDRGNVGRCDRQVDSGVFKGVASLPGTGKITATLLHHSSS
jgi:hypothetical protein